MDPVLKAPGHLSSLWLALLTPFLGAALSSSLLDAEESARLFLKDGTVLEGRLENRVASVALLGDDGSETVRINKTLLTRIEAGDPVLRAEFAIRDFVLAEDAEVREQKLAQILDEKSFTPDVILAAARRAPHRSPERSGRRRIKVPIRGTEKEAECVVVVPEGYDPERTWPLWISMHGTGGTGSQNSRLLESLAQESGFLLACPTEHPDQHGRGWGYSEDERSLTLSTLEEMKGIFQVDTDRVYLNGWSRGGHASYDIAEHYPALFAGINPIIGAPRAHYFGLLRNLKGIRCYVMNGALDQERLVFSAREGVRRLKDDIGADVTYYEDPERGHVFLQHHLPVAVGALLEARREVYPPRSTFASVSETSNVGSWIRIDEFSPEAYRPGATVKVPNLRRALRDDDKKTIAVQKAIFSSTAHVNAQINGRRIILKPFLVRRITLFLHDELLDLDRSFRVTVRGKSLFRGTIPRDIRYLLEGLRRGRDPRRLFWNEVTLEIP